MKKFITAAIAAASLAASLAPAPALAQSLNNGWVRIGTAPEFGTVFVRKHNWGGQFRVADTKYSNVIEIVRNEYNCSNGQSRVLNLGGPWPWRDVYPETVGHGEFRHVCS